jgi:hypothetical protein
VQSLLANPFNPTPPKNLQEGLAAIQKAKQIGAKTQRESDLISAIEAYYADFDKVNQRTRAQSYLKAMEQVASRYGDDDEVQIYYALALNIAAAPSDKTYASQLKAAAILEPLAQRRPQHPGVAHYLIHTYDYPALAQKGFDAALRYAKIAEAAPHAQHMPYIFTRIGYWKESVDSNRNAAKLAKAGKEADDELHASDYMVYAYLQLTRDREAREVIGRDERYRGLQSRSQHRTFCAGCKPGTLCGGTRRLDGSDAAAAATLKVRLRRCHYTFCAGAGGLPLGQSRSCQGRHRQARRAARQATGRQGRLLVRAGRHPGAGRDRVGSVCRRPTRGCAQVMAAAADAEDKMEKATVTPGPLAPARELQGEMLLEHGMAKEALAAFETTMAREPNRYRGLAGGAKAAELVGDAAKAKAYHGRLVVVAGAGDGDRRELAAAKEFLARR